MSPRRYRLIVFDWDGTLADSTGLIADAIRAACREVGQPEPDEATAKYVIGLGLTEAIMHCAPALPPEDYRRLAERYRAHYLAGDAAIPLYDGARELLAELDQAGFYLGVATGKTRVGLDRALGHHGLTGRFHATRCSDESFPKPHPQMLLDLMSTVRVDAAATLMIGDTTHDLDLARNAGAAALAVSYGAHPPEGLATRSPLATVHTVMELRAWLAANA